MQERRITGGGAQGEGSGGIVLAAGLGTRMKSRTPKVFHPFLGKPILAHVMTTLRHLNLDPLLVVINPESKELLDSINNGDFKPVLQKQQRGTGHAALCAAEQLKNFHNPILIVYGDTPLLSHATLLRLIEEHKASRGPLTLLTAELVNPFGYGRVVRDRAGGILRIAEEKDCTREERAITEVNAGVYCAELPFLLEALKEIRNENRQREFYLTDIVAISCRRDRSPHSVQVPDPLEVLGINTREELETMEREVRRRINREWMARGVTLEDSETTYIEPEVTIGQDTRIGPNTHLKGKTRIGKGCRIDGDAYLVDADIDDHVRIHFGVVVTEARLEEGVELGPFAHLRPQTKLKKQVKIGNFVEVKNSSIGPGTKANHLSYIGDATVGSETNIGAGTITCNYDGFRKHPTVIGDRVQVGSDVQLVAPVEVGDDAYIGAGSTITKRVLPGALALSRVPQIQKKGWVERFRERHKKK
jgi:bifunctional UDP-N-acetylglucosamine pyrophosphorylase/glucosamine-1-phosphate N-acetyltransferase